MLRQERTAGPAWSQTRADTRSRGPERGTRQRRAHRRLCDGGAMAQWLSVGSTFCSGSLDFVRRTRDRSLTAAYPLSAAEEEFLEYLGEVGYTERCICQETEHLASMTGGLSKGFSCRFCLWQRGREDRSGLPWAGRWSGGQSGGSGSGGQGWCGCGRLSRRRRPASW